MQPLQKNEQHLEEGILLQQSTKLRESQPITSDNDYYMDKLFMKDLPPTSSWMKFSGEGEYDHMEFIDWVDRLKADFHKNRRLSNFKAEYSLDWPIQTMVCRTQERRIQRLGKLERSHD